MSHDCDVDLHVLSARVLLLGQGAQDALCVAISITPLASLTCSHLQVFSAPCVILGQGAQDALCVSGPDLHELLLQVANLCPQSLHAGRRMRHMLPWHKTVKELS